VTLVPKPSVASPVSGRGLRAVEPDSLSALYQAHAKALHRFLRNQTGLGSDVDDLLQNVFVTAWQKRDQWSQLESPKGWLFGIAVRIALAANRRARFRRLLGLEFARATPSAAVARSPEHSLDLQERRELARAALTRMSERKRAAFILFEIEGLSGEEVAAAMGCPVGTVWTRLSHARREFSEQLRQFEARVESESAGRNTP
jgi:RNA polymerase sigma-70 factor, ECF subfamily